MMFSVDRASRRRRYRGIRHPPSPQRPVRSHFDPMHAILIHSLLYAIWLSSLSSDFIACACLVSSAFLSLSRLFVSRSCPRRLLNTFNIKRFYPIQSQSFDPIASGKDMIGRSRTGKTLVSALVRWLPQTLQFETQLCAAISFASVFDLSTNLLALIFRSGTGKTLAFVLPVAQRILEKGRTGSVHPSVLILEPTRELAKYETTTLSFRLACVRLSCLRSLLHQLHCVLPRANVSV